MQGSTLWHSIEGCEVKHEIIPAKAPCLDHLLWREGGSEVWRIIKDKPTKLISYAL